MAIGVLFIFLAASVASATPIFDLVATPGAGYDVSADGKTVTPTGLTAPLVNMALKVTWDPEPVTDPVTRDDPNYMAMYQIYGVLLSHAAPGAQVSSVAVTLMPNFKLAAGNSKGKVQDINGDGYSDVGPAGQLSGGAWVPAAGVPNSDWFHPSQIVPTDPDPTALASALGDQTLATMKITGAGVTYQFVPRQGAGNFAWVDAGHPVNAMPTFRAGGDSVTVLPVPEPGTVALLVVCGLGLVVGYLRRRG